MTSSYPNHGPASTPAHSGPPADPPMDPVVDLLAAWGECLADALRGRWPEATEALPLYPAFH